MTSGEEERAVFLLSFAIDFVVSVRRSSFVWEGLLYFITRHSLGLPYNYFAYKFKPISFSKFSLFKTKSFSLLP